MSETVSEVSETVSKEKYYLPGESFEKMAERIGRYIAAAEKPELREKWAEAFIQLIKDKKFIPAGRILANAGTYFDNLDKSQKEFLKDMIANYDKSNTRCGQMLNCYVIPIEDSKHGPASIYESLEDAADITAMEGGVGENFSKLRPKNWPIRGNPNYRSSGPISFLKIFDMSGKQLRQGGGRRSANMAVLDCDHPDIFEFIECKRKEGDIDNYNISVGIYDSFMKAVIDDTDWELKWNGIVDRTVKARAIFDKMVENAWMDGGGGEPGFIFLDTAKETWPFLKEIPKSTNPCGEQLLGNYEACDLGAINLFAYVRKNTNGRKFWYGFDAESLWKDIYIAIRFLDNILELNNYPLKYRNDICRKISMEHRRIGLGIMGLADVLMVSGIPYDSPEALQWINTYMSEFDLAAKQASKDLGKEKGFYLDHLDDTLPQFQNRRNCCVTTIAPTGTTSMLAGVWGGCEPYFGLVTIKNTTDGSGNKYYMVSESFKLLCQDNGIQLTQTRLEEIFKNKGSVQGISWFPESLQKACRTTMDISAQAHIDIQCTLQKYIENSISKTINLPNSASKEDVSKAIFALWHGKAKGGTVYRDGSRNFQIMNVGKAEEKPTVQVTNYEKRPDVLSGNTHKVVSNITHKPENIYITVNEFEGKPFEIFVSSTHEQSMLDFFDLLIHNGVKTDIAQMICSKIGQLSKDNVTLTTRLTSLALRNGVPLDAVVKQLRKINHTDFHSLHKKISKILSGYLKENTTIDSCHNIVDNQVCGGQLILQEGCLRCLKCSQSKCD